MSALFAIVHMPPQTTVPIAVVLTVGIVWYWIRLGRPDVVVSRRRIRRASMIAMLTCVVLVTVGMSFVDGDARPSPTPYVVTWLAAFVALFSLIGLALADMINTLNMVRRGQLDRIVEIAVDMHRMRDEADGVGVGSDPS